MRFGIVTRLGRRPAAFAAWKLAASLLPYGDVDVLTPDEPSRWERRDGVTVTRDTSSRFYDWTAGRDAIFWMGVPSRLAVSFARDRRATTVVVSASGRDCDLDAIHRATDVVLVPSATALRSFAGDTRSDPVVSCEWTSPAPARGFRNWYGAPSVYMPHDGRAGSERTLAIVEGLLERRVSVCLDPARWSRAARRQVAALARRHGDRLIPANSERSPECEAARHAVVATVDDRDPYATYLRAAQAAGAAAVARDTPLAREVLAYGASGLLVPDAAGVAGYVDVCAYLIETPAERDGLAVRAIRQVRAGNRAWNTYWRGWTDRLRARPRSSA